ncbi:hypothetical protein, partial [Xanthomonas oryzae]|uniref:hypothetical protein n=1 Tax=Xanthomonas oryzae TaxID=347 RepID=UPI002DE832E3|nr:hypothetical protein [Xanthomonas oryzae pv. oryzicola]MEC5115843.1 hypothetical protein [Xanthomonas oryzae pv. oryzicola]
MRLVNFSGATTSDIVYIFRGPEHALEYVVDPLLISTVLKIIVPLCHYWKTFRPRGRAVLNRTLEVRFEQYGEVVAAALS